MQDVFAKGTPDISGNNGLGIILLKNPAGKGSSGGFPIGTGNSDYRTRTKPRSHFYFPNNRNIFILGLLQNWDG